MSGCGKLKGPPKDVSEHMFKTKNPLCTESADAADDSFGEDMPGMLMGGGLWCSFQVEIF